MNQEFFSTVKFKRMKEIYSIKFEPKFTYLSESMSFGGLNTFEILKLYHGQDQEATRKLLVLS